MINESSPLIRRSAQQHYHFDRFYSNPNPNPNPNTKLLSKQHASFDWANAGELSPTMCAQPQHYQQKDLGFNLASSNTGSPSLTPVSDPSGSSAYMVSVPGETRGGGGNRFKSRMLESSASSVAGATAAMRGGYTRTKVVVRHLPPGLSESAFMEQIASRFSNMYNMVSFSPGKTSIKGSSYSRAYINFKHVEAVLDFYQEFNGHVFVNEKGTQYKAVVEYAPNQRVPKLWLKKDPREGTIHQDAEYIKFIEQISKPVELLPSAETQLERKETERSLNLGGKEAIVVTPLMEFVRQKRALKSMPQKSLALAGKLGARGGTSSMGIASKMVLKRGADRSRPNTVYSSVPRPKEKATYVPRYEESQRGRDFSDKKGRVLLEAKEHKSTPEDSSSKAGSYYQGASAVKSGNEQAGIKCHAAGKKILAGTDKEEFVNEVASGGGGSLSDSKIGNSIARNRVIVSAKGPAGSSMNHQSASGEDSTKSSQRMDNAGRLSRAPSSRTPFPQKLDQQNERDKRFSVRSQVWKSSGREVNPSEVDSSVSHLNGEDKSETLRQDGRRLRNKDRPDRPVWTVRQRGDSTEPPKNFTAGSPLSPPGGQRQGRGPRDLDNNPDASKPPGKRVGSSTIYGVHEKQVWVAKPGSGS